MWVEVQVDLIALVILMGLVVVVVVVVVVVESLETAHNTRSRSPPLFRLKCPHPVQGLSLCRSEGDEVPADKLSPFC